MEFRIADTFTDSLTRLTRDEQKAVKTAAFDLQLNPASPGLSFHRIDKSKDKNFWSIRVGSDIRLILHKTASSVLLCYVDHHDKAYAWAERRKLETHPKTGAAQLVEIRERVEEIAVPVYVEVAQAKPAKPLLFANLTDEVLLDYGVPLEWLADVRQATEDSVLNLSEHLPGEAAEALLELATGGKPRAAEPIPVGLSAFTHPDALRRFRVMNDVEELERAFTYPWDKWTIFLHPAQRELVEHDYGGPARVSGSAGTGKTVVALHRAVFLARNNRDSRVLLTTFSETLADALRTKLRRLISNEPRLGESLEVHAINAIGERLYEQHLETPKIASAEVIRGFIRDAAGAVADLKFNLRFLLTEWEEIVDAWQLETWESYRDVTRLGRKTRLQEAQRAKLWSVLEMVRSRLKAEGFVTRAEVFTRLASQLASRRSPPFDFIVVDEAQDLSVPQLRFLAALGEGRKNSLFFAGDLGQRIFQQPFSWKSLGVDIRGRSRTLHINYRTSHQIRMQTDRLLGPEVADVDGIVEDRSGTISVFNGPVPSVQTFKSQSEENDAVGTWLAERGREGVMPHEIGVFVRSDAELDRAREAVSKARLPWKMLDQHVETTGGKISIGTMHLAKGLEFRSVVVMACDDEIIPLQSRIEAIADDADLEEIYNTERHLLYVACTRARDHLFVTSAEPSSEFLDDLKLLKDR
jgi:mRNA-degrading endonuclease RelE of RelBE toxin-antitoxin system